MEAGHPPSLCDDPSLCEGHPPTLCAHHSATAAQSGGHIISSVEDQYPPLPPLRIGATTVSCVVCDTFNENIRRASLTIDGERAGTPPPLPTSHPDWNVRKWQTRQIAKAFMDNTINGVLEEMGFIPLAESAPDSDPDDVLGAINFPVDNDSSDAEEEEDESVENEGILLAIQSHGLQRHTLNSLPGIIRVAPGPSQRIWGTSPESPLRRWESHQQSRYQTSPCYDFSPASPEPVSIGSDLAVPADGSRLSPKVTEDDKTDHSSSDSNSDEDEPYHYQNNYDPLSLCRCASLATRDDKVSAQSSKICHCSVDSHVDCNSSLGEASNNPDRPSIASAGESSNSLQKCSLDQEDDSTKKRQGRRTICPNICKRRCIKGANEDLKCSSPSFSEIITSPTLDGDIISILPHSNERSSPTFGHFEFMDAAVAAAIQKKGLSALACQDL